MLLGALRDGAAPGGRATARCHQLRRRRRGDDLEASCSSHRDLAGVHFTGSTAVFNAMWQTIGVVDVIATAPTRASSAKRRKGLHRSRTLGRRRPPWRSRSCAAATSSRGRSVRRSAGSMSRDRSGRSCATRVVSMIDEHPDGRHPGLPQLHGRSHRPPRRSTRSPEYIDQARADGDHRRRRRHCDATRGFFVQPTLIETDAAGLSADVRRDLRPGGHRLSSTTTTRGRTRCRIVDATSPYALTGAVFARRSAGDRRGDRRVAVCRRQLLHQRQADRCGGRSAAVWRRPRARGRTTRPDRSSIWCDGSAPGRSRKPSARRATTATPS